MGSLPASAFLEIAFPIEQHIHELGQDHGSDLPVHLDNKPVCEVQNLMKALYLLKGIAGSVAVQHHDPVTGLLQFNMLLLTLNQLRFEQLCN